MSRTSRAYDVVMGLNYYAPYVSGLTDAARLVAEELAATGRRVLVVACRHDRRLPRRETINGVDVVRTSVVARIGKGLISPGFIPELVRHGRRAGVVNLHLPMIESGPVARLLGRTPTVLTYQCDIALPRGAVNRLQQVVMDASNRMAFRASDAIVPSSEDYAMSSRLRDLMTPGKTTPISPPTRLRSGGEPTFRRSNGPHVGFLGRIVEEKGVEYLVRAFRRIGDPDARLLIGGGFANVAGGSVIDVVREAMGDDPRIELLGFVPDDAIDDFYASIDVFALPSVNSFEAFGIVQVEAMRCGVAALSSDLPGVREPVRITGFGRIAAPRDVEAIERGLRELLSSPPDPVAGAALASATYSTERTVAEYSELFVRTRDRARESSRRS